MIYDPIKLFHCKKHKCKKEPREVAPGKTIYVCPRCTQEYNAQVYEQGLDMETIDDKRWCALPATEDDKPMEDESCDACYKTYMSDPTHTVQSWVAADEDGLVCQFDERPRRAQWVERFWNGDGRRDWDERLLGPAPSMTWDDEPRRVTVSVRVEEPKC